MRRKMHSSDVGFMKAGAELYAFRQLKFTSHSRADVND